MNQPVRRVQNGSAAHVSRPTGAGATFRAASGSLVYVIALCSVAALGGFLFGESIADLHRQIAEDGAGFGALNALDANILDLEGIEGGGGEREETR